MKVLCKKNLTFNNHKRLIFSNSGYTAKKVDESLFEENRAYPYTNDRGTCWIIGKDNDRHLFFDEKWSMYPNLQISKYFYTPEETINVLRTKLIDKILNE
jgi:hypothetical protein